jgi:hypothetical protein
LSAPATKLSIADTFSRLLRLTLPESAGPTLSMLMDASESRLGVAARHGTARERLVASRLLDNPRDYRRWELEHSQLMDRVLKVPRQELQSQALLNAGFSILHRKALFEFLSEGALRGWQRRKLIAHFHGGQSYTQAMVAEHGTYLRSTASLICVEHIGTTKLTHPAFGDPLRGYEQTYFEYFRTYCRCAIAPHVTADDDSESELLPDLKRAVLELRTRLLALPARADKNSTTGSRPIVKR